MDISYLLFLQDFRNSINDVLTPFMEFVSDFAIYYLPIVAAFIYWCVNKKSGLFALATLDLSRAVNALLKLTACVYRPWIRDARIIPAGDSIRTATGYSFPSGHSTYAMALYGGMGVGFWQNKKTRFLTAICVVLVLLTGFSRNYLGVHTPQDVLVGFTSTLLVIFGMWKLFAFLEKHPEKENWFLLGGVLLAAVLLVYFNLKTYPMDYIDGKLIVDPNVMKRNGFDDGGVIAFFCIARFIEKKWIRFEATGFNTKGIIISAIGLVLDYLIVHFLKAQCISFLGYYWGRFAYAGTEILFVVALWPIVIKFAVNKSKEIKK